MKKLHRNLRISLLLLMVVIGTRAMAQKDSVAISGKFLKDSTQIGAPVGYSLTILYPKNNTVVFPDSTYNFFPFTFSEKKYFTTETHGDLSRDSAVYYLKTFEIEPAQGFGLPVYIVNPADCTIVQSQPDTVFLQSLVHVPDSLLIDTVPFKTSTSYEPMPLKFNYPIALIITGALVIISAIVWLVFGEKIQRYFKLRKLREAYDEFSRNYAGYLEQLKASFSKDTTETTLSLWKKYMEQLESRPYTKLTTRETLLLPESDILKPHLKTIDRVIYGNQQDALIPLEQLGDYARSRFLEKIEKVKHG